MLAVKWSAGVASEVNQESVAPRQRSTQAIEPRIDLTRSPKTGVSVAPQKGLTSSQKKKKESKRLEFFFTNLHLNL